MSEEIKTSHFKTMEELLEHLKMWERDDDYEAYCRFFDYECAYAMAHYIEKLQKENEELKENNKKLKRENEALEIIHETYKEVVDNGNYISKNKIRNKIKELGEIKGDLATYIAVTEKIKVLKELLGE